MHITSLRPRQFLPLLLLTALLGLAGCAVELQNLQPAQDYAARNQDPSSVPVGWRVYQQRCAGCHGQAATGGAQAPDLLQSLRTMGPRSFVDKVLRRYDWDIPGAPRGDKSAQTSTEKSDALDALIEQIMRRQQGRIAMPAWQGDPQVNARILDLYAYLSARAEGSLGPGRPAPERRSAP